jgi:hypothetical protein
MESFPLNIFLRDAKMKKKKKLGSKTSLPGRGPEPGGSIPGVLKPRTRDCAVGKVPTPTLLRLRDLGTHWLVEKISKQGAGVPPPEGLPPLGAGNAQLGPEVVVTGRT